MDLFRLILQTCLSSRTGNHPGLQTPHATSTTCLPRRLKSKVTEARSSEYCIDQQEAASSLKGTFGYIGINQNHCTLIEHDGQQKHVRSKSRSPTVDADSFVAMTEPRGPHQTITWEYVGIRLGSRRTRTHVVVSRKALPDKQPKFKLNNGQEIPALALGESISNIAVYTLQPAVPLPDVNVTEACAVQVHGRLR